MHEVILRDFGVIRFLKVILYYRRVVLRIINTSNITTIVPKKQN